MAIYDYETLNLNNPEEMAKQKKKFVGSTYADDSKFGLSKFQLTTFDEDEQIKLVGVLDDLPEISFSVDYTDGPGILWQDMLQSFMSNDLISLINSIGCATGTEWKNFVKAGSWTKKVYNGYNPGTINLKFKIFEADNLGQTDASIWIKRLQKYAAISDNNKFTFAGALDNVRSGLKNMTGTGAAVGNDILKISNSNNATQNNSAQDDDKERRKKAEQLDMYINKLKSAITYNTIKVESVYAYYSFFIDTSSKTVTLKYSTSTSYQNSWTDSKLSETSKSYEGKESVDDFNNLINQLIGDISNNTVNKAVKSDVEPKLKAAMDEVAGQKQSGGTINRTLDDLKGKFEFLADSASTLLNSAVKKYGPLRVEYKFNRSNSFGAKLWYLNLYSGTIFKSQTPLIVYISNWSVKRSEEWTDSGHYYYEFNITCNLDQTYSRSQWYRVLNSDITSGSTWYAADSIQKDLDSGLSEIPKEL